MNQDTPAQRARTSSYALEIIKAGEQHTVVIRDRTTGERLETMPFKEFVRRAEAGECYRETVSYADLLKASYPEVHRKILGRAGTATNQEDAAAGGWRAWLARNPRARYVLPAFALSLLIAAWGMARVAFRRAPVLGPQAPADWSSPAQVEARVDKYLWLARNLAARGILSDTDRMQLRDLRNAHDEAARHLRGRDSEKLKRLDELLTNMEEKSRAP